MSSYYMNQTMELSEYKDKWKYSENYRCWMLEDILYTPAATTPDYQKLSIFAPAEYLDEDGNIIESTAHGSYTAATAPVVFENNCGGYMQMPNKQRGDERDEAGKYLERGMVYVTCGLRGRESVDKNGCLCGKSPWALVDLKTAIRFLRHNADVIPGDFRHMISVGTSAGGAMSTLLAVTANNKNYDRFLIRNGAFMEESDAVFAAQIYCPIVDLEHADLAYEWQFNKDEENEASFAGPAGKMDDFRRALSADLRRRYIEYFNSLKLTHPETGEALVLGEDGRSGSWYDLLMEKLEESATEYFIRKGEVPEETGWLRWQGGKAEISSLDDYVLAHRRRMKPCTAFDKLEMDSGENQEFGTAEQDYVHFSTPVGKAITELQERFPEEYGQYHAGYDEAKEDEALKKRLYLINPMNFIGTKEESDACDHYRINVGSQDADTAFVISMALAVKLANAGRDVTYRLIWDKPHCQADYPMEVCEWIEAITRK